MTKSKTLKVSKERNLLRTQLWRCADIISAYEIRNGLRISIACKSTSTDSWSKRSNLRWMIQHTVQLVNTENNLDRARRYLGFIQGAIWQFNTRTLRELHNYMLTANYQEEWERK